jgi:glycosyltransferase involved in cell wall biosynthesis
MRNKSMKKLVSIIITAYNEEKYIERAIISSLNQSYENIEVIVIDDGSNDKTLEISNKYLSKLKIFHNDSPQGLMEARNIGVRNAKGEYIAFLDGDDSYHQNKIEIQINTIQTLPEKSMLFTGRIVYLEKGIPLIPMSGDLSGRLSSFDYNDALKRVVTSLGPTFMMTKQDYIDIGYMDSVVGKERDFFARYSFSGGKLFRLALPLYIHHNKPGSMSTQTYKTYQREIKMLEAWAPSETQDPNRKISMSEYIDYEKSVKEIYEKKFSENINSSELPEEYRSHYLNRIVMYLIQVSKAKIRDIIGLFRYILFKIREKQIIGSITNTTENS